MQKSLIIFDQNKNILEIAFQNEKAYKKSIEHNQLWYVHEETGRVLPHPLDKPLLHILEKDKWYEAVLNSLNEPQKKPGKSEKKSANTQILKDVDILSKINTVLSNRKKEMPEGSYTTHLFESGLDKIRKKTGEEAIELILAEKPDEIIGEAADLIYHTMVLLQALDIPFNEIFRELKTRHS